MKTKYDNKDKLFSLYDKTNTPDEFSEIGNGDDTYSSDILDEINSFIGEDDETRLGDIRNEIASLIRDVTDALSDLKYLLETNEDVLNGQDEFATLANNVTRISELMDNVWDDNME